MASGFAAFFIAATARAQQSFQMPSAAQPSTGAVLFRQTGEYMKFGHDPTGLDRDIDQFKLNTQIAFGLTSDLTLMALVPAYERDIDSPQPGVSNDRFRLGDSHFMLKYRFWQDDTGAIDTKRAGLLAGLDVPTGDGIGNGGWDPMFGVVYTEIHGRNGINASLRYQFNTHDDGRTPVTVNDGLEDTLFVDGSYLFRLSPAVYDADTHGALYAMAEVNSTYETNGDTEVLIAPGLMYEARNWVVELSVQLPVYQALDHRPELDCAIGLGFRLFF
ncbi:MAG TPA: transporter [Phycisphaerales bacterium]|nr:transporter [Phycisphaerales bacterium]